MSQGSREAIDAAFAAHKREQARQALTMTMAERLAWLDRAIHEFGRLHGLAMRSKPVTPDPITSAREGRYRYSYADYLAVERERGSRHEYLDGEIFAMLASPPPHAALLTNLGFALMGERERGGRVYGPDLRIRVLATGFATHPDVSVIRGPLEPDPECRSTIINPRVVAEVLSDATEEFDRRVKVEHYRRIPSLRACLLVSHRHPRIEVWRRGREGWEHAVHEAGELVELRAIGVRFAIDDIYRGVLPPA